MPRLPAKQILPCMLAAFLLVACWPAALPFIAPQPSVLPTPAPSPLHSPILSPPPAQPTLPYWTPPPVTPPFAAVPTATAFPEVRVTIVGPITPTYTSTLWIRDLSFVDAQRGWLLATACQATCESLIRATTDGGHTWRPLSQPHGPDASANVPVSIRFADARHGWTFAPGLYSTADGGKTWQDEHRSVVAIEPAGNSVWAIEQTGDHFQLSISSDLGTTWRPAPAQPLLSITAQLVRPTASDAWILAVDSNLRADLFVTHDAARTWQALSGPWQTGRLPVGVLAASDNRHLWLFSGSGPATMMQLKTLYTSSDGGATWQTAAGTSAPGYGQPIGNMPIVGHLFVPSQFAAASLLDVYMALDRATLYATHDGGRTWEYAIPYEVANRADSAMGPVRFLDARHGWMVAPPDWLFRTADGGNTWERITVK